MGALVVTGAHVVFGAHVVGGAQVVVAYPWPAKASPHTNATNATRDSIRISRRFIVDSTSK